MNDNKCQKMMGRGVEGGCGTEEKPCTISRVSKEQTWSRGGLQIGFYEQARKALTERCPFDSDEVNNNISRVSTLPVGLADSLSKYTNNSRKRHKKSGHSEAQQVRSSNIWAETEDYFRPVGLNDIDILFDKSSFGTSLAHCQSYFTIRSFKKSIEENVAPVSTPACEGANGEAVEGGLDSQSTVFVQEVEEKGNVEPLMEIDGAEVNRGNVSHAKETEQSLVSKPSLPARSSVFEWLLGSRSKILLTSERPSKKRKLLGSDAGLDRLRVVCPSEGHGSPVCHVCCLGQLGEHSNQLLVCDSCKVAVHQKCYGVQEFSVDLWLCSWCKYCAETSSELLTKPCFLCPKEGGALKPVAKDIAEQRSSVPVKFIHLFCSQWMPEVYVEDTSIMEPIMNVAGIKETRKKLVCNICKVKFGACVRCSHGTCRTSFHPICAREARNRMEIWGKTGSDTVELRAFCSKHSDIQDLSAQQASSHPSVPVGCDSSVYKNMHVKLLVKKPQKLKLERRHGDQSMVLVPTSDAISNKSASSDVSSEKVTSVPISITRPESECHDAQLSVNVDTPDEVMQKKTTEGNTNGNTNLSESLVKVLKKFVDRGKASLEVVASEIGIPYDSLAATLAGDQPSICPDLHCKIMKWLRKHAYMGNAQSGSNLAMSYRARVAEPDGPNTVAVEGGDYPTADPIMSLNPRKTTSDRRIMKDNNVVCSPKETYVQLKDIVFGTGEVNVHSLVSNGDTKEYGSSNGPLFLDGEIKVSTKPSSYEDSGSSIEHSIRTEVELAIGSLSENGQANAADEDAVVGFPSCNKELPISFDDVVASAVPNRLSAESASCSYIHPFIQKRLMRLQKGVVVKRESNILGFKGSKERECSSVSSNGNGCGSSCINPDHTSSALKLEQLVEAKRMGILDQSPEDEVEGELIYFQNKLIDHSITSRRYCDDLISRFIKTLPHELDAERKQRWDSVLVNQFLCGVREAKKQGRKERRHKEAQAVLTAATAAAAASSRISSFRKDSHDEAAHQEVSAVCGRTFPYSQLMPRAKETLSRMAVPRVSSDKPSDIFQLKSFLNEHQQLCDICKISETMLNPIFVCCNCKVAVHFGCYRGAKDHVGPWYCELCEDLLPFRSPRSLPVHSREKSAVAAQCGLCGGTTGAFRKSTDGQWVHAFCAEWLLESTFRRGQPNLVEGMDTILKGRDVCFICSRKIGLCIKCNYGNCQSTFHPSCARNAGFYLHVKTGGGKLQHKGYCDRHSLEQREKAETQQHGPEELKAVKQIRVELERVRLLCERIIKREKVKRELLVCSHNILASKRDSVAFSVLVRSPFFLPDVSSESATTSLRGHVDDNKSCSEAMQRSEDITVDSAISCKRRDITPVPMDVDQKTDDSSTSQHLGTRKPPNRPIFSGKQLPHRPEGIVSRNSTDDEERRSKSRKHIETFQKELVMTSDQASVQNQRLPKGFAYVPVVCLPKEKPALCERGSHESVEPDG